MTVPLLSFTVTVFVPLKATPVMVFLVEPFEDELTRPFLIYVALMILAASVVVAATGPANLSRTHAKQVAVP